MIHLDTGWFENDWRCDYQFSTTRFKDPAKMIADLKRDGFHISLWQLPYFVPKNTLFPEILAKGLAVRDGKGNLPYEDAVLDFSNPATVRWYQDKIARPAEDGRGRHQGGFRRSRAAHRPLRQRPHRVLRTQSVSAALQQGRGRHHPQDHRRKHHLGAQRLGRQPALSAALGRRCRRTRTPAWRPTLRGGLSFGLSGFTFWSHDIGGFAAKTPEELYRRWLPFGMLTSHSRCHGTPPKEPWDYSAAFMDDFRRADELKYRLMPYVYAQAKDASERGLPMVRALFIEYPDDPGSWQVDDEYLFGSDILVAPLMEAGTTGRDVYLPPGQWIDYQTGKVYAGGWHNIEAGQIPVVMLVRDGAVIPHIKLAQSTAQMDWSNLEMVVFAARVQNAQGLVCLPSDNVLRRVEAVAAQRRLRPGQRSSRRESGVDRTPVFAEHEIGVPKMKMSSAVLAALVAASVAATLHAQVEGTPDSPPGEEGRALRPVRGRCALPDVGRAGA